jgi:hypothetical protein
MRIFESENSDLYYGGSSLIILPSWLEKMEDPGTLRESECIERYSYSDHDHEEKMAKPRQP